MTEYTESTIAIGNPIPMIGVVTEPLVSGQRPLVLILNSGMIHKTGSCRLSVKIARALAQQGFITTRFDLASIGDSYERLSNLSAEEADLQYCQECMDFLEDKYGCSEFILYGLCSGAFISFESACRDPRVVGVVQIDGYCYRTLRWYFLKYVQGMGDVKKSLKRIPALFKLLINHCPRYLRAWARNQEDDGSALSHTSWEVQPTRLEMREKLQGLCERNVPLLSIFTGLHASYGGQFEDAFPELRSRSLFESAYYPHALHIIPEIEVQQSVVHQIVNWADRCFRPSNCARRRQ